MTTGTGIKELFAAAPFKASSALGVWDGWLASFRLRKEGMIWMKECDGWMDGRTWAWMKRWAICVELYTPRYLTVSNLISDGWAL